MSGTVNYEALAASAPVNKDAAVARDGRGFAYTPKKKIQCNHWDAPPEMTPTPPCLVDYTGTRYGRLTVVGFRPGAPWIVRCSCGQYEARRTKSVTAASPMDRCQQCGHVLHLKRTQYRDRHGRWPEPGYGE